MHLTADIVGAKLKYIRLIMSASLLAAFMLIQGTAAVAGIGIERVSTDSNGAQATGSSGGYSISADGRHVAFSSDATDLVPSDTNGVSDVFVKDTQTGGITRVSTDSNGVQATGSSSGGSISADGRFVAFSSDATDLVPSDTNGARDIFLKDTLTGITARVSTDSNGLQTQGSSGGYSISADGRHVAFSSDATDLVPSDTNGVSDVFVKDTQAGGITRVSTDSVGLQATGSSIWPSVSSDGRFVAFQSSAADLVAGDTNDAHDIFLKDTQTGITTRISTDSAGAQSAGDPFWTEPGGGLNPIYPDSYSPSISSNGRYVAFESYAINLGASDGNLFSDIFVKDTQTGITTIVSTDSTGGPGTGAPYFYDPGYDTPMVGAVRPSISSDGHFVVFQTGYTNLVAGDTNGEDDIFVKDTQTGTTTRLSTNSSGVEGSGVPVGAVGAYGPSISSDGHFVIFGSSFTNLVQGDTNNSYDVFRTQVGTLPPVNNGTSVSAEIVAPTPAPSLMFSISGGTPPTGGTSDASSINFGQLAASSPSTGSQRLSVSTNAQGGYSVSAQESNPLMDPGGLTIPDVTADAENELPISEAIEGGWANATTIGFGFGLTNASGTDAVFTTGYRQFADALLGEGAQAVMSNGGPVSGSQVDVNYKVNVDTTLAAGIYSNTVTYIATGSF